MSDTINYQTPKPQFDIGRVINRTFAAIKNNFVNFFLASLVIVGIPMFLVSMLPVFMGLQGGLLDGDTVNSGFLQSYLLVSFGSLAVILIAGMILQGAIIYGSVADFNGDKAGFGESVAIGFRYFFPLIVLGIIITIGMLLGLLLLIIPGLLIALGWFIAVPILIVEKKGILDSISRSWELTKGYKRWIFLFLLIVTIFSFVISAVLGAFVFIAGDPTTVMLEGGSFSYYILNAVLTALGQVFATLINAVGVAAVYYEIRQIKEGIGAENLAAVFD